jgi:hypothetical protein
VSMAKEDLALPLKVFEASKANVSYYVSWIFHSM